MKRFLFRSLFFVLTSVIIFLGIYWLSGAMLNIRKKQFLSLDKNITVAFMGDSYIACSVNDSLIPHSVNLADNGESYMYTYVKLKNLLESNNQIKTVFVNYTYPNMDIAAETWFLFKKAHLNNKNSSYNFLLSCDEKNILFVNNPKDYLLSLQLTIQKNIARICQSFYKKKYNIHDYNYGGYYYWYADKLKEDKLHMLFCDHSFTKSTIQLRYLKKISALCKEHAVKLVLLAPPYNSFNYYFLNKEAKDYWKYVQNEEVHDSVLDLTAFPLSDTGFAELTHVNYKGARLFSHYLNHYITTGTRETEH